MQTLQRFADSVREWGRGATWLCGTVLLASTMHPARAGNVDLAAAKKQFLTSCGVCHSAEPGGGIRQGPNLANVYGRKVATYPGFAYSAALKKGDWAWDDKTLDPWIENAQAAHPGTYMNYRQSNEEKRALVIAYLKSLNPGK